MNSVVLHHSNSNHCYMHRHNTGIRKKHKLSDVGFSGTFFFCVVEKREELVNPKNYTCNNNWEDSYRFTALCQEHSIEQMEKAVMEEEEDTHFNFSGGAWGNRTAVKLEAFCRELFQRQQLDEPDDAYANALDPINPHNGIDRPHLYKSPYNYQQIGD